MVDIEALTLGDIRRVLAMLEKEQRDNENVFRSLLLEGNVIGVPQCEVLTIPVLRAALTTIGSTLPDPNTAILLRVLQTIVGLVELQSDAGRLPATSCAGFLQGRDSIQRLVDFSHDTRMRPGRSEMHMFALNILQQWESGERGVAKYDEALTGMAEHEETLVWPAISSLTAHHEVVLDALRLVSKLLEEKDYEAD